MQSLLLRYVNWLIALVLVAAGLAVLNWFLCLGLDAGAAGGLAGALFGAAALFVGAEISKYDQHAKADLELKESRARIRVALMTELVRISVNLVVSAKFFREAVEVLKETNQKGPVNFANHTPEIPVIYDKLLQQVASTLPATEIDALATFFGLSLTPPSNTPLGKPHGAKHSARRPKSVCI